MLPLGRERLELELRPAPVFDGSFDAVEFELDGTESQTAEVGAAALGRWSAAFAALIGRERPGRFGGQVTNGSWTARSGSAL